MSISQGYVTARPSLFAPLSGTDRFSCSSQELFGSLLARVS
ncbi:MAG: hypothetical protein ACKO0M_12050 [Cyanobium sp.]